MQCSRPSALLVGVVSIVAAQLALAQSRTLTAPASATVGAKVEVAWQGAADARDFITIVPSDAPEGRYLGYEYTRQSPVALKAPPQPGNYEVRYLAAASPYPTLARAPITIVDATATLTAPASVPAGEEFAIQWTGPDNERDFIGLVKADAAEGTYNGPYDYTRKGSTLKLRAPDAAGDYELRYMMADTPYRTLGRARVQVTSTGATVSVRRRAWRRVSTLAIRVAGPEQSARLHHDRAGWEARARVRRLCVHERGQSGVAGSARGRGRVRGPLSDGPGVRDARDGHRQRHAGLGDARGAADGAGARRRRGDLGRARQSDRLRHPVARWAPTTTRRAITPTCRAAKSCALRHRMLRASTSFGI